jgi:hypothetical protein
LTTDTHSAKNEISLAVLISVVVVLLLISLPSPPHDHHHKMFHEMLAAWWSRARGEVFTSNGIITGRGVRFGRGGEFQVVRAKRRNDKCVGLIIFVLFHASSLQRL